MYVCILLIYIGISYCKCSHIVSFLLLFPTLILTNPHWALVVGYGPFSISVIYKEGICPSSGDIKRLMMMMIMMITLAVLNKHKSFDF
jgi:hypothetical protein